MKEGHDEKWEERERMREKWRKTVGMSARQLSGKCELCIKMYAI